MRDRSVVMLIIGAVLLLPPVGSIALVDVKLGGLPAPVVYVFSVWALLIAGAAALAGTLQKVTEESGTDTAPLPDDGD
ncbi:MAG: hypothetical protein AAF441_19775 [Pseudomonadota bacterium]